VRKPVEQANLGLGFRTCSRHDPRRFALRLLNVILGENMSSRLFQVVREEHGLTYNINSSLSFWGDCGDLVISAGLDPSEVERTVNLVVAELLRLTRRAPAKGEFERARDYVLGQMDLQLENTEHHMMSLGEQWLSYGQLADPAEARQRISAVRPSELVPLARAFLTPERLAVAVVTPQRRAYRLEPLLDF
jgi:predicted Zn-dependent peptidase